ncbi:hypothetical protein EYR36_001870 [Pleurotus pulmonarius]|nr:hypothetical protein EYR36_001870 [Pleurotus pulmonarius]KAF4588374.1 hypothetical protein EYR38_010342 [Pleurotus pulmonarius]
MHFRMYNTNNGSGTFNVFNTERVVNQAPPKAEERAKEDLIPADKVIAVMGPTGVGKSTFINAAAGFTRVVVGDTLEACSTEIQAVEIDYEKQKVVLVDTPGFDDTHTSDTKVLNMIANWLKDTYNNKVKLTGIVYMHRITDNRMAGAPLKNLKLFANLCGTIAAEGVAMTTTMWDIVDSPEVGRKREKELRTHYWKPILDHGARMERFNSEDGQGAAWKIIRRLCRRPPPGSLLIQQEMVNLQRPLCETAAGRTLYDELTRVARERKKVVEKLYKDAGKADDVDLRAGFMEEYQRLNKELKDLMEGAGTLKTSFSTRFWRIIGLKKAEADPIYMF